VSGNARSRRSAARPDRSASRTGWDHVAGWYDGWVGGSGSRYHRAIVVPAAQRLLGLRPGERVLDVGCGSGVFAPIARAAGATCVGVDASPAMVAIARRRHGREGTFLVADAAGLDHPDMRRRLGPAFDAAVFLLSVQDMEPLGPILRSVGRVLRTRARIVLVLTHPAFRVPRHSGWLADPSRGLVSRRIDAYLRPMAVPLDGRPGSGPTTTFHRPISAYVAALAAAGFAIDAFEELADDPDLRTPAGSRQRDETFPANPDIPLFLAIRAIRG
jgi:SAM-dependent methyltransferase